MTKIISFLGCLFCITTSFCQGNGKLQNKGEKFLKKHNYEEGLRYFNSLSETDKKKSPYYNYYVGMIHYYSPNNQELGIPFFENYIASVDSTALVNRNHHHVYYVLAKLNHLQYNFNEAEKLYNTYIDYTKVSSYFLEEEKSKIIEDALRQIACCKFGRIAIENERNAIIQSLGDTVNTIYPEYAPVVSQDEKLLFFTSRRPDTKGGKKSFDGEYFEDIYGAQLYKGSLFDKKVWKEDSTGGNYFSLVTDFGYQNFHKVGGQVNSKKHDGSIQLINGDSVMFFYRDHDVWSVNVDTTTNTEPVKLGLHANSDNYEPSLFLSYDEQILFIVSDRPGGYGGLDIYASSINENGDWTEPVNLGPNVNTKYDEDAPYLDPDNATFYFSSKGHSSIGDYDIFRSRKNGELWSVPVNLGYPINTPADDIYFTMTSRYNRGYYASSDLKGNGDMDMYRITFADERDPVAEMIGFVRKGNDLVPAQSKISLKVLGTDESIETTTDSINGDYFLLLGHGKTYDMIVNTDGFAPYHKAFQIPEQKSYFQLYQEVHHVHLFNDKGQVIGQKITVYNGTGEADTATYYYEEGSQFKNLSSANNDLEYKDTDVKFYMTKDSLYNLMQTDSTITFDYGNDVEVLFLTKNGADVFDEGSYTKTTWGDFKAEVGLAEKETVNNNDSNVTAVENVAGLFFTVQIGVYSKDVPHAVFFNVKPINTQNLDNGTYRYSTGQFSSVKEASERRAELINLGITDAFVTAYYNGNRIGVTKAKKMIEEEGAKILFDPNW